MRIAVISPELMLGLRGFIVIGVYGGQSNIFIKGMNIRVIVVQKIYDR